MQGNVVKEEKKKREKNQEAEEYLKDCDERKGTPFFFLQHITKISQKKKVCG
jgi:hypothetical protein